MLETFATSRDTLYKTRLHEHVHTYGRVFLLPPLLPKPSLFLQERSSLPRSVAHAHSLVLLASSMTDLTNLENHVSRDVYQSLEQHARYPWRGPPPRRKRRRWEEYTDSSVDRMNRHPNEIRPAQTRLGFFVGASLSPL